MKKKSFLERLTGSIKFEDEDNEFEDQFPPEKSSKKKGVAVKSDLEPKESNWEEELDAELTVDLYQTPTDIIVQTMVAGVQPEHLTISITRDMITIRGERKENQTVDKDNYFVQELYWGSFSRTISLPEEVDPEEAEAIEKHGLLIIKLPKLDKDRETKLKIKSI